MNEIEIWVDKVFKQFKDVVALDNVSMRFASGKLYGIIGPAGAGKTTLFRIMQTCRWKNIWISLENCMV